jgi:hypothetical protein
MTGYTRRDLPADIAVFAGDFASQPLAFAHLLDAAPDLDLTHVEVDPTSHARPTPRHLFRARDRRRDPQGRRRRDTIVLILPAAHDSADCPLGPPTA